MKAKLVESYTPECRGMARWEAEHQTGFDQYQTEDGRMFFVKTYSFVESPTIIDDRGELTREGQFRADPFLINKEWGLGPTE